MFVAEYRNTMRGIELRRPKPVLRLVVTAPEPEPEPITVRLPCPPSRVESDFVARTLHQAWLADLRISRLLIASFIGRIAAWHGLTYEDILGPSRTHPVIAARFDAIASLYRLMPRANLSELGRHFRRDHTSIRAALIVRGVIDGPLYDRGLDR